MKEILDEIRTWSQRGERVAVATVIDTRRSAPRPTGAKMAISECGEIAGGVSGGCVEGAVVEGALEMLRTGRPRILSFGIADSTWDVGLPCGGEIVVFVEEYRAVSAGSPSPQAEFARLAVAEGRGALVTLVGPPNATGLGAKLLVRPQGSTFGSLGSSELDAAACEAAGELLWAERSEWRTAAGQELFVDVTAPAPRLLIFGAVDYASALCRLARVAGWRPFVCDPRAAFATPARFPEAEEVLCVWPDEAFERLGLDRATYVAVLTHDPKIDDAALLIALRSDASYVGAMGSRRAQERRRERLTEAGLTEAELERMAAPIGLDLGATSHEETAVSIMAELIAVRNGHDGGRLCDSASRIHEVGA